MNNDQRKTTPKIECLEAAKRWSLENRAVNHVGD